MPLGALRQLPHLALRSYATASMHTLYFWAKTRRHNKVFAHTKGLWRVHFYGKLAYTGPRQVVVCLAMYTRDSGYFRTGSDIRSAVGDTFDFTTYVHM